MRNTQRNFGLGAWSGDALFGGRVYGSGSWALGVHPRCGNKGCL